MAMLNHSGVADITSKMKHPDKDFRYMALNDLQTELVRQSTPLDDVVSKGLVNAVLQTLSDSNGEVQSMGVKCLGPLVRRSREQVVQIVIDRLCKNPSVSVKGSSSEEGGDISSVALRNVILEISPASSVASSLMRRLTPQLLSQLKDDKAVTESMLDTIDVLIELVSKFGQHLSQSIPTADIGALVKTLLHLLDNPRPAIRKRSVLALAGLSNHLHIDLFSQMMSTVLQMLQSAHSDEKLKTLVFLLNSLCRSEGQQDQTPVLYGQPTPTRASNFAGYIQTTCPAVFSALDIDDDELRELCLQAIESFVLYHPEHMKRYDSKVVEDALIYIKYDPNYNDDGSEDEEDQEMADEDDEGSEFDVASEDEAYSDDEDISWKLRRCSAKVLAALIESRPDMLSLLCSQVASVLISRFNEREENVRVEILMTFAALVRQTASLPSSVPNRKRAREDNTMDTDSLSPQDVLLSFVPRVAKGLQKQLLSERPKSATTKKAGFTVVANLSQIQDGALDKYLSSFLSAALVTLSEGEKSHVSTSTTSNLKMSALSFVSSVLRQGKQARENGLQSPSLNDQTCLHQIVSIVLKAIEDKFYKIASEGLELLQELVHSRALISDESLLAKIYAILLSKGASNDLDQEVRDKVIKSIGITLACTPLTTLVDSQRAALSMLADKVKNEATRLVATTSLGLAASCFASVGEEWTISVVSELAVFLKNTNKSLRSAALVTLPEIVIKAGSSLPDRITNELVTNITTSLNNDDDLQLLPNYIDLLTSLLKSSKPGQSTNIANITCSHICELSSITLVQSGGNTLHKILDYFSVVAQSGQSDLIMDSLPNTDLSLAQISVISKIIAVTIRAGDRTRLQTYLNDVKGPKTEESKRVLALYVLGEYGLLEGLIPGLAQLILSQFASPSGKVKNAAAFAFGNSAAGDIDTYLPLLLQELDTSASDHYLLAIALKELIIRTSESETTSKLAASSDTIWTHLLELGSEAASRIVVSECIGRLTLMKSEKFLPELRKNIHAESSATRAIVIRAIRYTFTAASSGFDDQLRPFIVDFLSLMEDEDLEIRRLALSTLYSAAHNKPHLIQDHLSRLLPFLYQETLVRTNLIHVVVMGPFKHTVDDGLEIRKSAFETMHTLLESFFSSLELNDFYDKVITGLGDVNEIKVLCNLMITQLATKAPVETTLRLNDIGEKFDKIVKVKVKDSAVKQEREKIAEMTRSTLRTTAVLVNLANESHTTFNTYVEELKSSDKSTDFHKLLSEQQSSNLRDSTLQRIQL